MGGFVTIFMTLTIPFGKSPNCVATGLKLVPFHFAEANDRLILLKITIPNTPENRYTCLKELSLMNVDPLTLFPDLEGTSRLCNLALEIPRYGNL